MSNRRMTLNSCALLLALPLCVSPLVAVAQPALLNRSNAVRLADVKKLQPTQITQLKTITQRYDQRLMLNLQSKPALKTAMETELRAIEQEKDEAKREAMIMAYQAKHKDSYQAALRESNVDINAMAREMAVAVPDMDFRVVNGLSVVGTSKMQAASLPNTAPAALLPAPSPRRQVKNLTGSDYEIEKEVGCGAIAGSEVTTSGGYMTNKGTAISSGACRNEGSFTHEYTVRSNEKVDATITLDMSGKSHAIGIIGSAGSSNMASVSILKQAENGLWQPTGSFKSVSCTAFALVLWAAYAECEIDNIRLNTVTEEGKYRVVADTYTNIMSALSVGGASAESRIKKLRTTLVTEPK